MVTAVLTRAKVVDRYARLRRARAHTPRSLRELRQATSAHRRRYGLRPSPAPAELLASLPVWPGQERMLQLVEAVAARPEVVAMCRKAALSPATFVAIISNDILDADYATGRGMRTSRVVAAARVGRSKQTVSKARTVAQRAGLAVPCFGARELTYKERMGLLADEPRHEQRGHAMVWAYTLMSRHRRARIAYPRPGCWAEVVPHHHENGDLPSEAGLGLEELRRLWVTMHAADAAARRPPPAGQRRRGSPGLVLAHQVLDDQVMQGLLGVRPGSIAPLLAPWAAAGWQGVRLVEALRAEAAVRGLVWWRPAWSPYGLLKSLLSAIDPYSNGPLIDRTHVVPAEPCSSPGCDGFGWLEAEVDANGYMSVRQCPACRPASRSQAH